MELEGQVVIVAGGGGRIGHVIGEAIAVEGGVPVLADKDAGLARRRAAEVQKANPSARMESAALNITSHRSVTSLLHKVHRRYGRVDGWINCAYPRNKRYGARFESVTYKDFCGNVSLHLGGYFLASQQAALFFRDHGGGTILNVASIYGVMAPRFEIYDGTRMTMPVEYAAIKAAIIHLTRYMAKYCKGWNVRVNCLSPGGVATGQPTAFVERYNAHGLRKGLLSEADIAGPAVFLMSKRSEYVQGQNIIVDDGFSL